MEDDVRPRRKAEITRVPEPEDREVERLGVRNGERPIPDGRALQERIRDRTAQTEINQ